MPSFDVVSQVDLQEVDNAINQARKEVTQRYDFKGSDTEIEHEGTEIRITSSDEYKVKAVVEVLQGKAAKRQIPSKAFVYGKIEAAAGGRAKQVVTVQQGIAIEKARQVVKIIKDAKLKVQAQIQGDQVRVTGKVRDELQRTHRTALAAGSSTCRSSSSTSATDGRAAGCGRRATRCSDPAAWVLPMVDRKDPACTGWTMNPEGDALAHEANGQVHRGAQRCRRARADSDRLRRWGQQSCPAQRRLAVANEGADSGHHPQADAHVEDRSPDAHPDSGETPTCAPTGTPYCSDDCQPVPDDTAFLQRVRLRAVHAEPGDLRSGAHTPVRTT